MSEEFDTDQLVEFCQRLGLAKDGYLDEKELAIVCNCIGLQAPEEMMKELFEELDTDKDGRVCLDELSQMLRGMPKNPASPEKLKIFSDAAALSSSPLLGTSSLSLLENAARTDFSNIAIGDRDRGAFSILDPQNSGFTKVGMVLDFWSQLGITQEDGVRILKDMGFPANSRLHSLNVQDLTKALEDEADNSKDALPLVVQTALITYRTEAQYLRSVCDSMECERDKLKSDVYEAHQRSTILAQEVDEQNSRLEKNSQLLLRKMEAKYSEQIHELQEKFSVEKDTLQQALQLAESQLKSLHEDDSRLKQQLTTINNENSALERELQSLNQEIRNLNRTKNNLEKEISRYVDLENRLLEMERRTAESTANNEGKLIKAYAEMQFLRDQNDELSTQLEGMKETVKVLKTSQEKRSFTNKKRKGSRPASNVDRMENMEDCNDSPLEKIGKFNRSFEINTLPDDPEELESSIDPLFTSSCSQPDSGNFPVPVAISLAACMGESSTDSPTYPEDAKEVILNGRLDSEYKTLEIEMDTVKDRIVTIITEKEQLMQENRCLKNELGCRYPEEQESPNLKSVIEVDMEEIPPKESIWTQTVPEELDSQNAGTSNTDRDLVEKLRSRIMELENEALQNKAAFEKETKELKEQCSDLENSLDLLRVEYEKCEDYWQDKLREAREFYEEDRSAMDEKFNDLAMKINEYEDTFLPAQYNDRLPPIEERASLERQVTDLEDECDGLRKELHSVKLEQDSIVTNYQRQWETKAVEECGRLELQVGALSQKCKDYESRLSSLAEEERSTLEESGMMDMLKDHVRQLEFQLKNQDEKYKCQIAQLERTCRDKDDQLRRMTPELPKTSSPSPQPMQIWKDVGDSKEKSRSLLEMLQQSKVEPMAIWPQRYANSVDKSSSLPFIPVSDQPYMHNHGGWGMISPNYSYQPDLWAHSGSTQGKKAWCHVELGWLQALRSKLKQRDEQCYALQRTVQQKEMEADKIFTELRYKHDSEVSNWENIMHASQELVRQQAIKHKEQAEKLAHSDLLMKDLWVENSKLMAALNATEQRVLHLDSLLKYQMNNSGSHNNPHSSHHNHAPNQMPSSPRSLQHPPRHFSTRDNVI